jgi:hypothetical protein
MFGLQASGEANGTHDQKWTVMEFSSRTGSRKGTRRRLEKQKVMQFQGSTPKGRWRKFGETVATRNVCRAALIECGPR